MNTAKKKPGPVPGPLTVKATLRLEPELLEWGKHKPGGLSELVRRLLREEYEKEKNRSEEGSR
jgi:hypothetical protein